MNDDEPIIPFAIVPSEVAADTRLTLETMRVLIILYSFRDKNTGLAFPSREALSARCGMHPSNISEATTKLVELGWIIKVGKGGHSKATRYTVNIPEIVSKMAVSHREKSRLRKEVKVAEQATVAQSATIAEQATRQIAEQATRQIAEQATRKEQTNEHTNITDHFSVAIASEPKNPDTELQSTCKATWKSYATAYFNRYGVEPLRNAEINTAIKSFCKKIPHQEAPHVAAFFVLHNDKYYVQKTHHPSLLRKDAEGLRTQWATGRTMTSTRANQLDSTATNASAAQEAIAMLRRRNGNASV